MDGLSGRVGGRQRESAASREVVACDGLKHIHWTFWMFIWRRARRDLHVSMTCTQYHQQAGGLAGQRGQDDLSSYRQTAGQTVDRWRCQLQVLQTVLATGPTFNVPLIASLGKGRAWRGRSLDPGKGTREEVTEPHVQCLFRDSNHQKGGFSV